MPSFTAFLPTPFRLGRRAVFLATGMAALAVSLQAAPQNLGLGLKELVEAHEQARQNTRGDTLTRAQLDAVIAQSPSAQVRNSGTVLVDIYLDGTVPLEAIAAPIAEMRGGEVTGTVDWYRNGMLSAWVPIIQVSRLAGQPGVSSVILTPPPALHIGAATSQGVKALHADTVNATYKGAGITVGVLSDSYNVSSATIKAPADVTSGDLPGSGNPDGYTTPVNVLQDYTSGTDEGRAMCQIVHDVAPASAIAFATGNGGTANFANNIIALATPVGSTYAGKAGAGCKVVCDDLTYSNETMFSDGIIAQAVDQATGLGATYFSSAGNDGNSGYLGTFSGQANNSTNQALLLSQGGITYSGIASAEQTVISQFHSFGTSGGNPVLVQKVLIPAGGANGILNFQWDDPSDVLTNSQESVSTDYDLLVFSVSGGVGTYQSTLSLTGNNFSYNEPIEYNGQALTAGTQYEFVIVRTTRTPPNAAITANQANHLRWVLNTDSQQIIGDYVTPSSPNSYGHTSAATCNSTAAYQYDQGLNYAGTTYTPIVEAYSSNGNANIYFNSAGARLATPETRKQPTLAAIDGVDTTFFGTDTDGSGKPNFYGTSAASPHAAACAALLLNAASVLNKPLTPAGVRAFLVNNTQGSADQDPGICKAILTRSGVPATTTSVTLNVVDHSLVADKYSYNVGFVGTAGQSLSALTITVPAPLTYFYPGIYAVTQGAVTGATPPSITSSSATNFNATCTLNFSSFDPGDALTFGVAHIVQVGSGGNYYSSTKTDLLTGATVSATVTDGTYTGTLTNVTSRKWNYKCGYGLIDISAAVTALTNGN